jgi:hypothetical protein
MAGWFEVHVLGFRLIIKFIGNSVYNTEQKKGEHPYVKSFFFKIIGEYGP